MKLSREAYLKRLKIVFLTLAILGVPCIAYYHVKHPTSFSPEPPEPLKNGMSIPDPSMVQSKDETPPDDFVLMDEFHKVKTNFSVLSEKSDELPRLPLLVPWCQGEWCGHIGSRELTHDVPLFSDADSFSKVIQTLPKGTFIPKGRVFTKVNALGTFTDTEGEVSIVSYASEGQWVTFQKGKWDTRELADSDKRFVTPKTEDWIYVELSSGVQGWIAEDLKGEAAPFLPGR